MKNRKNIANWMVADNAGRGDKLCPVDPYIKI